MQKVVSSGLKFRRHRWDSFTLIELLVVMALIAILTALVLAAAVTVQGNAARDRARSEIKAMETALENYKTDNGTYPVSSGQVGPPTGSYSLDPTPSGGLYQISSQLLFQALSGKINYNDTPVAGVKSYVTFKANQLGNAKAAAGTTGAGSTYVQDPWGYSYGYSTGDGKNLSSQYPYNGAGFFDLWSTGGKIVDNPPTYATNSWISNWQQ